MQGAQESPPPARPRRRAAKYRRRRVTALALTRPPRWQSGLVVGSAPATAGDPSRPRSWSGPCEAEPVHFTVSASGDLLIHSPVWEQALALGGGSHYDFAAELNELKPYVAEADLGICHVETPMTPAPPASYPIFNTPPELADGNQGDRMGRVRHRLEPLPRPGADRDRRHGQGARPRSRPAHRVVPVGRRAAQARVDGRQGGEGRVPRVHDRHERDPGAPSVVGEHRERRACPRRCEAREEDGRARR